MFDLSKTELKTLKRLNTPQKIQDFLNKIPFNFERKEETLMSPRRVLRERKAHCLEGALLASTALWMQGEKPLLLDLKTTKDDSEHVVALFRRFGRWGAISKTNHAVLRYREPVYATVRELALSYFHEYFLNDGRKTLRSYSDPFDLSKLKNNPPASSGYFSLVKNKDWLTSEKDLWYISKALDRAPHHSILTSAQIRNLRLAEKIERSAGKIVEWTK